MCAVLFQNSLQKWATQLGYTTQTLLFIEFTPCWIGRKRSYNLYFRCLNAKPEIIKSIEFYKYMYLNLGLLTAQIAIPGFTGIPT